MVVMANNAPQGVIISPEMLDEYNKLQAEREAFVVIDQIRARNKDKKLEKEYNKITAVRKPFLMPPFPLSPKISLTRF